MLVNEIQKQQQAIQNRQQEIVELKKMSPTIIDANEKIVAADKELADWLARVESLNAVGHDKLVSVCL